MATYYVRVDGNDANTGLGSSAAQAWQTISKALGATGIGSGDTLYIAPGTYRQGSAISVGGTYSSMTYVYGDPTGAQFTGVPAGLVRITTFTPSDTSAASATTAIAATSKSNLTFANLLVETGTGTGLVFNGGDNIVVQDCVFTMQRGSAGQAGFYYTSGANTTGATVQRCQFFGGHTSIVIDSTATSGQTFKAFAYDNLCEAYSQFGICVANPTNTTIQKFGIGCVVTNNIMIGGSIGFITAMNNTSAVTVRNNVVINASTFGMNSTWASSAVVATNNLVLSCASNFSGMVSSGGRTAGVYGFDIGEQYKFGLSTLMRYTNWLASPNIAAGSTSDAPATDQYNVTWYSTTPDIGAVTYRNVQNILPTYAPTERNASTITIAPGSTSQSIELYLGVTGLTASTSGLSAYYNRTRSADVQINLQARNITQNWTSGGFAEVNPNTMPGVYRLDIPNEALAAGADDVTVVVRGASGTNGAVMSIKLSSGGLTTAQTASAVWGALTNDHTTHGTFGWNVLRADQDSKEGLVTLHQSGGISRVDADIHAIANDTAAATALKGALNHDGTGYVDSDVVRISTSTAAANELEGALLHNGTDYIDSNLLSGNSTRVFVGRFQLTQTGTTQGDIIEAFTTDTPSFELQLFDGDNNIVPVTGATLGLRILDVTSTVVETGTPTIEYGTGGIVRWTAPGSYVSIGCPAGMYRLFVDRTVSGTTTTFGPLQIKVQVQ